MIAKVRCDDILMEQDQTIGEDDLCFQEWNLLATIPAIPCAWNDAFLQAFVCLCFEMFGVFIWRHFILATIANQCNHFSVDAVSYGFE